MRWGRGGGKESVVCRNYFCRYFIFTWVWLLMKADACHDNVRLTSSIYSRDWLLLSVYLCLPKLLVLLKFGHAIIPSLCYILILNAHYPHHHTGIIYIMLFPLNKFFPFWAHLSTYYETRNIEVRWTYYVANSEWFLLIGRSCNVFKTCALLLCKFLELITVVILQVLGLLPSNHGFRGGQ